MIHRVVTTGFLCLCQSVFATSGWDDYRMQVGQYIIGGSTDYGTVVRHKGPEELPILTATMTQGLCGPPSIASTRTHLVIRYYSKRSGDEFADSGCFAIRRNDGIAIGPVSAVEVETLLGVEFKSLAWQRPSLPTHWPYTIVLVVLPALFLVVLSAGAFFTIRRVLRARRLRSACSTP